MRSFSNFIILLALTQEFTLRVFKIYDWIQFSVKQNNNLTSKLFYSYSTIFFRNKMEVKGYIHWLLSTNTAFTNSWWHLPTSNLSVLDYAVKICDQIGETRSEEFKWFLEIKTQLRIYAIFPSLPTNLTSFLYLLFLLL